jgi:hypothetical protein
VRFPTSTLISPSYPFWIPGFPDSRIPRFPDSPIPGFPDSRIPRFPDSPFPVLKIAQLTIFTAEHYLLIKYWQYSSSFLRHHHFACNLKWLFEVAIYEAWYSFFKACNTREQLAELTTPLGSWLSKLLSCADSFREDLTSLDLEENICRVWYFSPCEEKISASAMLWA